MAPRINHIQKTPKQCLIQSSNPITNTQVREFETKSTKKVICQSPNSQNPQQSKIEDSKKVMNSSKNCYEIKRRHDTPDLLKFNPTNTRQIIRKQSTIKGYFRQSEQ